MAEIVPGFLPWVKQHCAAARLDSGYLGKEGDGMLPGFELHERILNSLVDELCVLNFVGALPILLDEILVVEILDDLDVRNPRILVAFRARFILLLLKLAVHLVNPDLLGLAAPISLGAELALALILVFQLLALPMARLLVLLLFLSRVKCQVELSQFRLGELKPPPQQKNR